MLITQFETLEEPTKAENDVYEIDISMPLDDVIESVINKINSVTHGALEGETV